MNHLSEQEIISIAEHVAKTTQKESILFIEKEYRMKSAQDFLENWIKVAIHIDMTKLIMANIGICI